MLIYIYCHAIVLVKAGCSTLLFKAGKNYITDAPILGEYPAKGHRQFLALIQFYSVH